MFHEQPTIIPNALIPVETVCMSHSLMILWRDSVSVHDVLSACQVFMWTVYSFDAMSCCSDLNEMNCTPFFIMHVARGKRMET